MDDTPAEIKFTWRRIYAFLTLILTTILVGMIIAKLVDPDALKWVAIGLLADRVIVAGFYLGGASLVDWARLAASWKGRDQ
jgi:hypothetical protein